jgi:hypothetical protein
MKAAEASPTAGRLSSSEAAAAIMALINSKPISPRQEEIEAILACFGPALAAAPPISDLRMRLRKAMARSDAALQAVGSLPQGARFDLAEAALNQWEGEIAAMEKEIPHPPRSFEDLVARAEIARHGGDVVDGKLMEAENEEDVFVGPAARRLDGVVQVGKGGKP